MRAPGSGAGVDLLKGKLTSSRPGQLRLLLLLQISVYKCFTWCILDDFTCKPMKRMTFGWLLESSLMPSVPSFYHFTNDVNISEFMKLGYLPWALTLYEKMAPTVLFSLFSLVAMASAI